MAHFWSEINWQLILSLVVIGGLVAYLGDIVGTRIGKRRISLFGLRPRHTSSVITVITGILIVAGTFVVLAATSETVHTALFSMKFIQRQISSLTEQLQESRQELEELEAERDSLRSQVDDLTVRRRSLEEEVANLKKEADELRRGLEQMREERILAFAGELLGQVSVGPNASAEEVQEALNALVRQVAVMASLRVGTRPEDITVTIPEDQWKKTTEQLVGAPKKYVIRMIAESNLVRGDPVHGILELHESHLVYQKGQELISHTFTEPLSRERAEGELLSLLQEVNNRSVADGILRDPLRGTVGNISASDFFDAVDELVDKDPPFLVTIEASDDIYTEGPVRVKIKVEGLPSHT